jgi:hypothetical protein
MHGGRTTSEDSDRYTYAHHWRERQRRTQETHTLTTENHDINGCSATEATELAEIEKHARTQGSGS